MMARMKLDELNILNDFSVKDNSVTFDHHDFIDHYFDPMQISKKQKEQRIEAAKELMDVILYFLIWCEDFPEEVVRDEVQEEFANRMKEVVFQYGEPDEYFSRYIPLFIDNLIKVTLDHKGEEYFTSVERAALMAVNESNVITNYTDFQRAKEAGFTMKQWLTEMDNRVRPTHQVLESMKIPIDKPFVVGNSLMMFPKDQYTYGADPEEIVNCRCVCKYI